jgi:hypothetical protein
MPSPSKLPDNPRHCTRIVTQRVENADGTISEIRVKERRLKKQHDKQVANERRRRAGRAAQDTPDASDTDAEAADTESTGPESPVSIPATEDADDRF